MREKWYSSLISRIHTTEIPEHVYIAADIRLLEKCTHVCTMRQQRKDSLEIMPSPYFLLGPYPKGISQRTQPRKSGRDDPLRKTGATNDAGSLRAQRQYHYRLHLD